MTRPLMEDFSVGFGRPPVKVDFTERGIPITQATENRPSGSLLFKRALQEYDMTDSDEANAAIRTLKADDCYSFIWDLTQKLRSLYKYSDEFGLEDLEELREWVNEELLRNGINLDKEYS